MKDFRAGWGGEPVEAPEPRFGVRGLGLLCASPNVNSRSLSHKAMEATKIDQASCKICRLGWNGRKRPLEAKLKAQQLPDVKAPASDSATPCEVCEKRLEVFRLWGCRV